MTAHKDANTPAAWDSEEAINVGVRCLKHFYPEDTQVIVSKVLQAAAPHLPEVKLTAKKPPLIGDEAIEMAAETIYSHDHPQQPWKEIDYRLRWTFREDARVVLEAVALHLHLRLK